MGYYDMEDFMGGCVLPVFFGAVLLIVILGGIALTIDAVQSVRAREAIFACESRNLQYVRKSFSTQVACRPRNTGSDTLTVQSR